MVLLSLAAGTVLDADPAAVLDAAASAGYQAAGLRLDPATTSLRDATRLRRRADDLGLAVLDLEVVRLQPDQRLDQHLHLVDLAEELGAQFLLTVSQHEDETATVSDLQRLDEATRGLDVRVALEFMRFTAVPTLGAALAMLDRAGTEGFVVLVDALHLYRSGGSERDLAHVPGGRLGYVQVCDGPLVGPSRDAELSWEARHDRLAPGTGGLPLTDFLAAVAPGTPVSVEVQSDVMATQLSPTQRATHLLTATRNLLASVPGRTARV